MTITNAAAWMVNQETGAVTPIDREDIAAISSHDFPMLALDPLT